MKVRTGMGMDGMWNGRFGERGKCDLMNDCVYGRESFGMIGIDCCVFV